MAKAEERDRSVGRSGINWVAAHLVLRRPFLDGASLDLLFSGGAAA